MPAFADALYNQGLELARAGRLAEARDRLTTVVTLGPTDVDAWVVLGKVHAQRDDLDAARDCWGEALRLAPERADAKAALRRAETIRAARGARGRRGQAVWAGGLLVMLLAGYAGGAWRGSAEAAAPLPRASSGTVLEVASTARSSSPAAVGVVSPSSAAMPASSSPSRAAASPSPAMAPRSDGRPRPTDDLLPRALTRLLAADPQKRFRHVTVETDGARPALSGQVSTDEDRMEAVRLARTVLGTAPIDHLASASLALYTLQRGDTLWSVAAHFYGDGDQWPRIARANPRLPHDPTLTREGTVIEIPK